MRPYKKAVACLMALLLLLSTFPLAFTASADASGTCGSNLTWVYDPNTFTLTISGSGNMANSTYETMSSAMPWREYAQSIQSVVIGSGVTSIGYGAFYHCTALTSVTISDTVSSIGDFAFSETALTSIELPDSLTETGGYVFCCTPLTEIVLPPNLEVIREDLFQGCDQLVDVTIPEGVTRILENVFWGCTSMTHLHIPASVQYIGDDIFRECWANTPTICSPIDDGLAEYYANYFGYQFELCAGHADSNAVYLNYSDDNANIEWLGYAETNQYWWMTIQDGGSEIVLTAPSLPYNYKSVGTYTLADMDAANCHYYYNHNEIHFTDGLCTLKMNGNVLTLIGTFTGDNGVTYVVKVTTTVPSRETVEINVNADIADVTWYDSGSWRTWDLFVDRDPYSSDGNYYLGYYISISQSYLNSYSGYYEHNYGSASGTYTWHQMDDSLCYLHYTGGYDSTYFVGGSCTITQNDGIVTLSGTFIGDDEKTYNITITNGHAPAEEPEVPANACGDNLTWSIENNVLTITGTGDMYDYCNPFAENPQTPPWMNEYYTEVVIGSGVTSIGSDAFANSSNLTAVTIPNTVTSIGDEAFLFCESLSGVVIPNSVTTIGERAFLQCTGMSTLTLGSGVTEIKIGAFASCSSLTSLVIPDNVEIIGISAFEGCSGLTSLTIGSGVTSIGATAFASCSALVTINYNIPNLPDQTDESGLFAFEFDPNTNVTVTFGSGVQRIPAYLFWIGMPGYGPNIKTVNLPSSVTSVGHDAFYNCTTITNVYYGGTQQQWDAITKGSNNDPLLSATLHCTAAAEEPEDTYSLSVGDQVAVNLILDLDTRGLTVSDVSVTLDGQPVETTVTNDGDQYRFTIITAPAQIADEIVVTVGDETITTTVMDYCVALCGHAYDEYEKEQNLAKAILQYGKAANEVFDWTDEEITTFGELDHQPVQNYTGAIFTDGTHQITGASFMALAKPEFRFYMSGVTEAEAAAYNQANNITAAYRDTNITEELHARFKKATRNGESVVLVEVTGVSAENMNEEVIVNIPGLGSFTFNGNAFAKAMASDSDPVTQNFGAALYNYGVAANTCFKPKTGEEQP